MLAKHSLAIAILCAPFVACAQSNLIQPANVTLGPSQIQQFTVVGQAVAWYILPSGLGSITPDGLYTAPSSIPQTSTVLIYATPEGASQEYMTQVTLTPGPPASFSILPASISLFAGQTKQFTAVMSGADQNIAWSISPPTGSIANGLYTAPASVSSIAQVTVSATSVTNPSNTATATLLLIPALKAVPVRVSVSPASVTLVEGHSVEIIAAVSGSPNTGVTWSLSPQLGKVINGTYTAPPTINADQQVQVIATSEADTTKTATATVSLIIGEGSDLAVPSIYQDLFTSLKTQIAAFDAAVDAGWDGSSYPYFKAPQLGAANSVQYMQLLKPNHYAGQVAVQLSELQALGANAVTVHINFPILYQPFYAYIGAPSQYQQFVEFYQRVAQDVRARGMKLVIETTSGATGVGTDLSQFQAYMQSLAWPDYAAGRAANALAVAQLIEPDYMTVMTEPDTEAATSGQSALQSVAGVVYLVQNVLTTLQQAGVKNVQVGGGVGTWTSDFTKYVAAFASLPIDFFDMHIYSINKGYFLSALTAADAMLAAGKRVAVSECWTFKERDSELGTIDHTIVNGRDPFSFFQPIDISFLRALIHFAKYKHAIFLSPYWDNYFFAYLPYGRYASLSPSAVLTTSYRASSDAMQAGAFTPTGQYWRTSQIPPDTTPPATPAAPTPSVIEANSINLQWEADTDNVGVSAYNLYRNGSLLKTTSELFYDDSGLVSGSTYTYNLTATDASGNVSAMSAPLIVATAHITVPSLSLSER